MTTKLKQYFPMIRTKMEILNEIGENPALLEIYEKWNEEQQKEFLDICTGVKGMKMLYDPFSKEILSPELAPERLEELLSLFLGKHVKILKVLPNDSTRIADESSLLIMDIVVELEDGSLANIEVQKMGYLFPGQRCACYSADLLLRQYKRVKGERKKKFSYKDIKKVYTIVLSERSSAEFHAFPNNYIHHSGQKSDTGLKLELLQEYTFIPLDIFREILHNYGIRNKMEAWLTFLSTDEPEYIIKLIEEYPEFKQMYEEVYTLCLNTERVMGMFSKELLELDRNTVQYMIDEMQDTIDEQKEMLEKQQKENEAQKNELEQKSDMIAKQQQENAAQQRQIEELKKKLEQLTK